MAAPGIATTLGVRMAEVEQLALAEDRPRNAMAGKLISAFLMCHFTSLIVFGAVAFGSEFVRLCTRHPNAREVPLVQKFAAWDGQWYRGIVADGYSYKPREKSNVAFYPLYPVLARVVARTFGASPDVALLAVGQLALVACFAVMALYFAERSASAADWGLLAFGLAPHTFYFRMTYSESTFLLLVLLAMYGMERRWPDAIIALVIGLATASRSTALALAAPFAVHLWLTSRSLRGFVAKGLALYPIACWGLLAYMAYQQQEFGDALAFVKTSKHWNHRQPSKELAPRIIGLLTLEPLRVVYDPKSPCYWAKKPPGPNVLFNLFCANPVYFMATVGLVAWGYRRGWLNGKETLLSAGLLLIPYLTHAERGCMASEARYASVAFPVYMVLGRVLYAVPPPLASLLVALSGCLMAAYSALFVSWYWFY